MAPTHTLMTVHAHPDDETISTGGVMARYSRAGHRVICVTCTGGEHGEIVVPEMDTAENHAKLGELRAEELRRALAKLGPVESRKLGYVDSGMMGTPENEAAASFWQADIDEAAGRLVKIVRETRPDVMVGYNDFGGYGHPDHINAGRVCRLAFERAGDPAWYPEQLAGGGLSQWQPKKLYETIFDMSRREEMAKVLAERGIQNRWNPPADETDEQKQARQEQWGKMAAATGPKTTSVDIGDVIEDKLDALKEHVTQIAPDFFFVAFTPEEWRRFQPTEDFTLKVSYATPVRIPEDDLFAGID